MNFKDNIKQIRKEKGLSQEDLAEALGVTRQSVSKWEQGLSYPEMDKVVEMCKLFDLDINVLLNKEYKGKEEKQKPLGKISLFIKDTVKLISNMSAKQITFLIIEEVVLALIMLIIGSVVYLILEELTSNILYSILSNKTYYIVINILNSLYVIITIIIGLILLLYIFKIRYLDYYTLVDKDEEASKKVIIEKRNENIVIRDPMHSRFNIFKVLGKFFMYMVKIIAFLTLLLFGGALILDFTLLVVSFLIVHTKVLFAGLIIILIGLGLLFFVIIYSLYNFIFNGKFAKKLIFYLTLTSLVFIGCGTGLSIYSIKSFTVLNEEVEYQSYTYELEMGEDLIINSNFYNNIKYIESDIDNIVIELKYPNLSTLDIQMYDSELYLWYSSSEYSFEYVKQILDDLNEMKFVSYEINDSITIYANKDNIDKLKNNLSSHYNLREKLYNAYEKISELEYYIEANECYCDEW